ncbi:hypothetical protein [Brevibacterium sp. ZH18]|uniref:hypothetical protein n=1 Tax=Brevibacterium sp. ZH18 TaxID=2927784 RepID=UPI001F61C58A|nr:hypothetical protein [Brevibacterium sp. ZH18]MCI4011213.1 hypothetical protein [Brevibacterium sp. ZH18]
MPIEDGIRKAAKNLDEAANAAPTSQLPDDSEFGIKDENADKKDQVESEDEHEDSNDSNDIDDSDS